MDISQLTLVDKLKIYSHLEGNLEVIQNKTFAQTLYRQFELRLFKRLIEEGGVSLAKSITFYFSRTELFDILQNESIETFISEVKAIVKEQPGLELQTEFDQSNDRLFLVFKVQPF